MDEEIQLNLNDESRRVLERLSAAKKNFIDAYASYAEFGEALELDVCEVLANYYNPANRRALLIQRTAQELSEEIKRFGKTVSDVEQQYITASSAVDLAMVKLLGKAMENYIVAFSPTRASDPLAAVNAVMEGLSDAQKQNVLLRAQGIVVGQRLAAAVQVAAGLLRLRQAELKSYLGEAPPGDALSIREALVEAVASEGAWTAAEYVLTEVGKAIGTAIPIANIVISIATIALDLRSKIRALQSRYEPGDIDLMLNLSEEMGVEREAVKDAIKLFGEISSLSSTELKLKPESETD